MKSLLKTIALFLILATSFLSTAQENDSTTTYYFIRHAEKDRSNPNDRDPKLTQEGLGRAVKWAEVLKNISLDAVYSTNYNRTRQTAAPSAIKNKVETTLYDPRAFDANTFRQQTKGKTVLIVGHSNTTPQMVNAVIGAQKYQQIDDNNNGNLYVVTIEGDNINSLLLYIE